MFEAGRFDGPRSRAWALRLCDAQDAIHETWEPRLQQLEAGRQKLGTLTNAEDWEAYRGTWAQLVPAMKELEAAALANRDMPGAAHVLAFFQSGLNDLLYVAGFGPAHDVESFDAGLMAAMQGPRAGIAARIGLNAAIEAKTNGILLVRTLVADASRKVVAEYRREDSSRR